MKSASPNQPQVQVLSQDALLHAIDVRIAEKVMGETLTVAREQALAMVGVYYVRSTGNPFSIDVPGRGPTSLAIPTYTELAGHPSDYNPNARYFRYVAQHLLSLGGEIAARVEREIAACHITPPSYSTDITAAWLVVEKLVADGWHPTLSDTLSGGWFASFWHDRNVNRVYEARGNTAPLAICHAALRTVEAA